MNKVFAIIVLILVVCVAVILFTHSYNFNLNTSSNVQFTSTMPVQNNPTSTPEMTSLSYEIHINLPNTLMLVDSQGRRAGENPKTDTVFREIPGASGFGEDGKSGEMDFSYPLGTPFTLYVLAGQTGVYDLDLWMTNLGVQTPPQRISGNIQAGSMIAYVPEYDSADPASSTIIFQSVVSSTASITTAPPDNLPPPPVP
jgi:hypothetical protein